MDTKPDALNPADVATPSATLMSDQIAAARELLEAAGYKLLVPLEIKKRYRPESDVPLRIGIYRATDPVPDLAYPGSDAPRVRWTPSSQMPRWASRIALQTVDVSVRRFNDWSEDEALTEGVEAIAGRFSWNGGLHESRDPLACSRAWFEARYGLGAPDTNPFVWVLSYRRTDLPS